MGDTVSDRYEFSLPADSTAVVVVDMQNDFLAPDGFFARVGVDVTPVTGIVPAIARVVASARAADVPVIYTRMWNKADEMLPALHRILPRRDRDTARTATCVEGTPGAQIVDALAPLDGDAIVDKTQYSAFFRTDMEDVLARLGVDTVVVTGATTNVCVDSFVRDAYFRGMDVVLVEDAVASYEQQLHDATIRNVDLLFGAVADADYVTSLLRPAGVAA